MPAAARQAKPVSAPKPAGLRAGRERALRAVLIAVAALACAWFALGIRQAIATDRATAIVYQSAPLTPAQAARAAGLLDDAATLNPDRTVDVLRASCKLGSAN